jgi:TolA-binding protein
MATSIATGINTVQVQLGQTQDSLGSLATLVAGQFRDTNDRVTELEGDLGEARQDIGVLEGKMEAAEADIDQLDARITNISLTPGAMGTTGSTGPI